MDITKKALCINRGYILFEVKKTGDELEEVTFEITDPFNETYKELGSLTQALVEFNEIVYTNSDVMNNPGNL